jgi:hypothetical protein
VSVDEVIERVEIEGGDARAKLRLSGELGLVGAKQGVLDGQRAAAERFGVVGVAASVPDGGEVVQTAGDHVCSVPKQAWKACSAWRSVSASS